MVGDDSHLKDDALIRRYLADRSLDALGPGDEAGVRHVANCAACAARYERLTVELDATAALVEARVDSEFPGEQLTKQRERILRRVAAQTSSVRVLPFPAAESTGRFRIGGRLVLRWAAAAAVAAFMLGLTAGHWLWPGGRTERPMAQRQTPVMSATPGSDRNAARTAGGDASLVDDDFLSQVDFALAAPRTKELQALDALTLADFDTSRGIR